MKNKSKNRFFIVCGILAAVGILLGVMGAAMGGFVTAISIGSDGLTVHTLKDREKDNKISYINEEKKVEAFQSMDINLEYVDIEIKTSDHYGIEYKMNSNYKFSYKVENNCLKVTQKTKNNFSLFSIGVGFYQATQEDEYVIIYVPENVSLKNIVIKNDSADITYVGINANYLNIENEYGDIEIKKIESDTIVGKANSGKIHLSEIKADSLTVDNEYGEFYSSEIEAGKINLKLDSGNCKMDQILSKTVKIDAEYGNIIGNEIKTDEIIIALDCGDCEINGITLNKANIDAEYGEVKIVFNEDINKYGYDLRTEYGDITFGGEKKGENYHVVYNDKNKNIKINCESGDIKISQK